jgi:KDO2-lipid IV(A) lauroyltransferase
MTMPSPATFWARKNAGLRYGLVWCAFKCMRVMVKLPLSLQLWLGKRAGRLARLVARNRNRIARRNLAACFPTKPADEIEDLLRQHFAALGASVFEMAMGWYGSVDEIRAHTHIEGIEHLEEALDRGRGVILFSAHFTAFEFFFPVLAPHCPRLSGMYKVQRNPLMNEVMNEGRGRNFDYLFPKDSVRDMIRELKRNAVIWYASDQSFGGKGAVLIPFFGVPAMTNTAISRIARATGATVLPYFCRRIEPDARYLATIGPAIEDFPTEDAVADTRRLLGLLERFITTCPEQYWWIHQRFKGRPAELPDIYEPERLTEAAKPKR